MRRSHSATRAAGEGTSWVSAETCGPRSRPSAEPEPANEPEPERVPGPEPKPDADHDHDHDHEYDYDYDCDYDHDPEYSVGASPCVASSWRRG